jgi:uncharacterized protein YjeT (DUF2065 family)
LCALFIARHNKLPSDSWDRKIMWEALLIGFALMLVLEGIVPFLYPAKWRNLVATLSQISDKHLRTMGMMSMLLGIAIVYWIR